MSIEAALLGHFASIVPLKPSVGTTLTYDNRVDTVPATYHWPLREASGITFAQRLASGVHPASSSGFIEFVDGTLVQDDTSGRCIGMGSGANTSVLTVASHVAFDATAGAFFCVIQPDKLAKQSLMSRRETAASAGTWYLELTVDGGLIANRRDGSAEIVSRTVSSGSGLITVGVPQLVGISWGGTNGLRAWVGSAVVAAEADPVTTNWTGTPGVPLRFGRWHDGADGFDGLMAHIVFLAFDPTPADVAKLVAMGPGLSLLTGADLGEVQDGAQSVFNIRTYGHFSEVITNINETTSETNITVTDSGETFTVTGVNVVTNETFGLSVTDARGTTAAANFTIDVTAASSSGEYITTPEEHGLTDPSSVSQVRSAFAAAIADASANAGSSSTGRGVVELTPGRVYQCAPTANGTNVSSCSTAILLDASTPNVEIRTQGTPSRSSGNQAILRAHNWSLYSGVMLRNILKLFNASNVKIGWVTVDGNKLSTGATAEQRRLYVCKPEHGGIGGVSYTLPGSSTNIGNGGIFSISVMGGNGITFKEVNSHSALVDALYLRRFGDHNGTGTTLTGTTNALFEDCNFDRSRRVGLAHISAGRSSGTWDQVIFRRCTFNTCGDEASMVGERPGWGVDIEPANIPQQSFGVTYEDCTFNGNQGGSNENGETKSADNGRGFQVDAHAHLNYHKIIRPTLNNNRTQGMRIGVRDGAQCVHWVIEDLICTGNGSTDRIDVDVPGTPTSSVGSAFTDFILDNVDVPSIVFSSELPLTGHTITFWKNNQNHPPTISTPSGFGSVTINAGVRP